MQKNAQASKRRIYYDADEVPGLASVSDVVLEMGEIEIPGFKTKRRIPDGVKSIPAVDLVYRTDRDTQTAAFFDKWWEEQGVKDVTVEYTDGHGVVFKRELWQGCELAKKAMPAYDALAPTYMQYQVKIIPWDIIDL